MEILNVLGSVSINLCVIAEFYFIIRYLGVLIADRQNKNRRKKYSYCVLFCMIISLLILIISFIINFKRNNM